MKKSLILIISFLIILSMNALTYGAENNGLRAEFSVKNVSGTNFKEITINPYRYVNGERVVEETENPYYIYLPSGYFNNSKTASYVVDKNGKYPFTVYYQNTKKTFFYTVNDIDNTDDEIENSNKVERNNVLLNYELKYDYEKKQLLFHITTDKVRNIITPDKKATISNEINYYLKALENNKPFDFSIMIDNEKYEYKIIKQGEYYLLVSLSTFDYDSYSTVIKYIGYNFINNDECTVFPSYDIYDDNGNYEALVKSSSSQSLFNYNVNNMDYRRPDVSINLLDDNTFELEIKDDFELDYLITFDGKYVPISGNKKEFKYNHSTIIDYDGDYIFTVVDKKGNKTVESIEIDSRRNPRKHNINFDVHDYKYTHNLFENKGRIYEEPKETSNYYENILVGYMNGNSSSNFNPSAPITRAEMITIFCRINDLPYDTSQFLKTKFIDINNHWARHYISMGSSKKYVSGYKDKTFRPDNYVTKAEFCEMLSKISNFKSKINSLPATSNYEFKDINTHWAKDEIIKISNRSLVIGSNNYFYPDKPINRAEVAHAINKLYGFNPSNNELKYMYSLYNKYYNFSDINNNQYYNDIIISVVGMYKENIN